MYKIDFSKPDKVHFIGIGGISMSGLAEILINAGFTVTGSDRAASDLTRNLRRKAVSCTADRGPKTLRKIRDW